MARFRYTAITPAGERVTGVMDADSRDRVTEMLRQRGQTPVRVEAGTGDAAMPRAGGGGLSLNMSFGRSKGFATRDLAMFTRELSVLLAAGVTLDRALAILSDLSKAPAAGRLVMAVRDKVRTGSSFSDAMASVDAPGAYVGMTRAGEAGGTLDTVLSELADHLEKTEATKTAIRSALTYPAIVMVLVSLAVVFMLTVVLPEFKSLFASVGRDLPLSTRMMLAAGDAIKDWWHVGLGSMLALVLLINRLMQVPSVRFGWDRFVLKVPLFGALIRRTTAGGFGRTLAMLLESGVAPVNALGIARDTVENMAVRAAVGQAVTRIREGDSLSNALERAGALPPIGVHLVRVGEESGTLPGMLRRMAGILENEANEIVKRMIDLLTPALTIVMGLIVTAIIGSVVTAVFSAGQIAN